MEKRTRSKNLSNETIEIIVQLLDGWASKLTWDHLISAIDFKTQQHYTRQALSNHPKIKLAFDTTKQRLSKEEKNSIIKTPNDLLIKRLEILEFENKRLENENNRLLKKFTKLLQVINAD
jgi:hypothetical protein